MPQPLRPLIPRPAPGQQNVTRAESGNNSSRKPTVPKRKPVPIACGNCRKRKTRCGGERPTCHACIRNGRSQECTYETESQALKRKYCAVDDEDSIHRRFVEILRYRSAQDANDILNRLRSGTSVEDLVRQVESGDMLMELSVAPEVQWRHNPGGLLNIPEYLKTTNNPYIASLIYRLKFDSVSSTRPRLPPTANLALYNAPYHTAGIICALLDTCQPSKWTSVSTDDVLLRDILRRYFTSIYTILPFFHKDYFLNDMVRGNRRFCSSLLVNSVLAAGCRAYPRLPDRHEFWNPSLLQYKFLAEARRLWELSVGRITITGIQAATVLNVEHGMNSHDNLGLSLSCSAIAAAQQMGLFDDYLPSMSNAQRTVRSITAWGIFGLQALQSYHHEQAPLITSPPKVPFPAAEACGEIWIKYAASNSPAPIHFTDTFIALSKFRTIMNDITDRLYSPASSNRNLDLDEVSMFHHRLQEWYHGLPSHLDALNLVFPVHFHMHMHYWLVVERLWTPYSAEDSYITTDLNPRKIIEDARTCMRTLIRLYYGSHGDDGYELFIILIAQYVGFSALASRSTTRQTTDTHLQHVFGSDALISACILRGQGRMTTLGNIVLKLMYKTVTPDLASQISKFTNINEESRPISFNSEQAIWPMYVGQASDRDNRSLGNLFRTISELSGDDKEGDEEVAEGCV